MSTYALLGVCGLYCGSCNHYKAYQPEGKSLLEKIRTESPNFEECHGCRSDKMTTSCSNCTIKNCAANKGILHCGLCTDYPCDQIKKFQFDGRIHHIVILDNLEFLKRSDPEQWLLEQENRWTCKCGMKYSWYEDYCSRCSSRLPSYSKL